MNNDLKTIVERVIPAIHFALVTPQDIAVLESADDLWAALVYRKSFECMIFASPDINLLCRLVGQKYVRFIIKIHFLKERWLGWGFQPIVRHILHYKMIIR